MDRVEEEQPEEPADRLLHADLTVEEEAAGLLPGRVVHLLDFLQDRIPGLLESIDHVCRRELRRRAEGELTLVDEIRQRLQLADECPDDARGRLRFLVWAVVELVMRKCVQYTMKRERLVLPALDVEFAV